jgi:hypothetical protein
MPPMPPTPNKQVRARADTLVYVCIMHVLCMDWGAQSAWGVPVVEHGAPSRRVAPGSARGYACIMHVSCMYYAWIGHPNPRGGVPVVEHGAPSRRVAPGSERRVGVGVIDACG